MTDPYLRLRERLRSQAPARIEEPGTVETSVALALAPGSGGLGALLIVRAEHPEDPWSGQIALPGGRREAQDADRLATALRETAEETGVALPREALLGELDDLHPRTPSLPPVVVRPFVFGLDRRPAARPSAEVAGCLWAELAGLQATQVRATVMVRGAALEVPAYRAQDRIIWGITYRILASLLDLL